MPLPFGSLLEYVALTSTLSPESRAFQGTSRMNLRHLSRALCIRKHSRTRSYTIYPDAKAYQVSRACRVVCSPFRPRDAMAPLEFGWGKMWLQCLLSSHRVLASTARRGSETPSETVQNITTRSTNRVRRPEKRKRSNVKLRKLREPQLPFVTLDCESSNRAFRGGPPMNIALRMRTSLKNMALRPRWHGHKV